MLFYTTADGGIAIGAFAPAKASFNKITIVMDTTYPFEDIVRISVTSATDLPLYLRIPGWASKALVSYIYVCVCVLNVHVIYPYFKDHSIRSIVLKLILFVMVGYCEWQSTCCCQRYYATHQLSIGHNVYWAECQCTNSLGAMVSLHRSLRE